MIDSGASTSLVLEGGALSSLHAQLEDDHDVRAALCAELEQMADALPSLSPPARVRRICNQIECVTSLHFRRADLMLAKIAPVQDTPLASEMLERLAGMHLIDAMHGEDLITVLWDSTARGAVARPGEFGYMLRCFFVGCRRAAALESALLTLFERQAPRAA